MPLAQSIFFVFMFFLSFLSFQPSEMQFCRMIFQHSLAIAIPEAAYPSKVREKKQQKQVTEDMEDVCFDFSLALYY